MGQPICNYCDVPIAVRRDPDGEYRCDHECNPADIARAQAERAPAKSAVEKSFAAPVQEEATPTLDAATAIRVLTAVAEMYDGKAKHNDGQLSKARDGRLLSEVQREIADVAASVASALPALLEASRRADPLMTAAREIERTQLMEQVRLLNATCAHWEEEYFKSGRENDDLREQLAGSISERETLTAAMQEIDAIRNSIVGTQRVNWSAHIYPLVAALGKAGFVGLGYEKASAEAKTLIQQRDEAEAAVARLTTENTEAKAERDKFRNWFQNAEQARAVAEAKLKDAEECDTDYRASLQQAEAEVERLTREKAQLATQLQQSQQFREQAIQDIEALPFHDMNADGDEIDPLVRKSAVLLILGGSNG